MSKVIVTSAFASPSSLQRQPWEERNGEFEPPPHPALEPLSSFVKNSLLLGGGCFPVNKKNGEIIKIGPRKQSKETHGQLCLTLDLHFLSVATESHELHWVDFYKFYYTLFKKTQETSLVPVALFVKQKLW